MVWSDNKPTLLSLRDLPWTAKTPTKEEPFVTGLPLTQQNQNRQLLSSFPGPFSTTPGHTIQDQHVIEIPAGQLCCTALQPLPKSHWEAVNKEVQDMLHLGIIEPSNSVWRGPVLVPKLDGSICFCIDFREINKVPSFNACPMPWASTLLSQLGKAFASPLEGLGPQNTLLPHLGVPAGFPPYCASLLAAIPAGFSSQKVKMGCQSSLMRSCFAAVSAHRRTPHDGQDAQANPQEVIKLRESGA